MISKKMEEFIREIYADSRVSPEEIIRLRNATDEAAEQLLAEEGGDDGVLGAVGKSFDVTNQLVQESILRFSKGQYTDTGRAMALSLLESEIELLRATVEAFK
jgi:hypothetical protein